MLVSYENLCKKKESRGGFLHFFIFIPIFSLLETASALLYMYMLKVMYSTGIMAIV